jgi:hypothetical protein
MIVLPYTRSASTVAPGIFIIIAHGAENSCLISHGLVRTTNST